jgi:hypothetical protein
MKKIIIDEQKLRKLIRQRILEEQRIEPKTDGEQKQRCVAGNIIPLDDIVGPSKNFKNYTSSLFKRDGGINGMIDTLDMLKTLRLHDVNDGGEHLSYNLMNHLNGFRNKKYHDETNNECNTAMDKVIELYKENEHGEELVKDIEKVLRHSDPTPRAKEYLKRCLTLVKEK